MHLHLQFRHASHGRILGGDETFRPSYFSFTLLIRFCDLVIGMILFAYTHLCALSFAPPSG